MILRSFISVLAVTAFVASCGGSGGGSSESVDLADSLPSAAVCNGEPNENVPESGNSTGYAYLNGGDGWSTGWNEVFGEDKAIVGDDAGNILCATVTESSEVERCEYEDNGESFTLILMEATYDIELRFAKSANVIGRDTGTATADECPVSVVWTPGEGERRQFAPPTEALEPILTTFFG